MENPHRPTFSHHTVQTPKLKKKPYSRLSDNYISHTPSPMKTRSSNGLEKYYISQHKKNAVRELEFVSNRIAQLQKQESKAKRKIELAQKFSEQINRAKERHCLEIQTKELLKELKQMEEMQKRQKNKELKEKRNENIKKFQLDLLKERQLTAQKIKTKSKELDKLNQEQRKMMIKEKYDKKYLRYNEVLELKQKQENIKEDFLVYLKDEYEKKIAEEKSEHLQLMNRKKELEKLELEMVHKFANTSKVEENVMKDLESIANVSLFHLGLRI